MKNYYDRFRKGHLLYCINLLTKEQRFIELLLNMHTLASSALMWCRVKRPLLSYNKRKFSFVLAIEITSGVGKAHISV